MVCLLMLLERRVSGEMLWGELAGSARAEGLIAMQGGYLLRDEAQCSIQHIVSDNKSPHTAFKPN